MIVFSNATGINSVIQILHGIELGNIDTTRKIAALRAAFFQLLRSDAAFGCNRGALRAQYFVFLAEKNVCEN